jgi:hypothetical protein
MVDLDVEYQTSSLLYGLKFGIVAHYHRKGVNSKQIVVIGDYHPAGFKGMWNSTKGVQGDTAYSTTYQSKLTNPKWYDESLDILYPNETSNAFLRDLRAKSPEALSIAFTIYGFINNDQSERFTYGNVVGTIGPLDLARSPVQYVRGRQMNPLTKPFEQETIPLSRAEFLVRALDGTKTLTIDLSNSLRNTTTIQPRNSD